MATVQPKVLYSGVLPGPYVGGAPWVSRTLPVSANWNAVAYGAGMFVAVNSSGSAATSPDGITWTARTMPTASNWVTVIYGGGKFLAVATGSTNAATSPDGITWTAATMPSSAAWKTAAYGNGTYVAIAYNSNAAATSPDGITWTARTMPASTYWQCIAYGRGTFVAVIDASAAVAVSPDGITWTLINSAFSAGALNWRGIAFGGDVGFVVVAAGNSTVQSSPDGFIWAVRTGLQSLAAVTSGEDAFVAISSSTVTQYSGDIGVVWPSGPALPSGPAWNTVVYGAGTYVAVGNGPTNIAASSTNPANVLYRAPGKTVVTSIALTGISGSLACSLRIGKVPIYCNTTTGAYTALDTFQVLGAGSSISGYCTYTASSIGAYITGYELT